MKIIWWTKICLYENPIFSKKYVQLRKANPMKGMRMVAWDASLFAVWKGAKHRPAGGEEIGGADRHMDFACKDEYFFISKGR